MSFEYLEIGSERGGFRGLVLDTETIPQVLSLLEKHAGGPVTVLHRVELSEHASRQFEFLADFDHLPDPEVRFPVLSIRYAISCMIDDGETIEQQRLAADPDLIPPVRQGRSEQRCPPGDVDASIRWIKRSRLFKEGKHDGDEVLKGQVNHMHQMLLAILQDNMDSRMAKKEGDNDTDDWEENDL